jgi:hypothetical protein
MPVSEFCEAHSLTARPQAPRDADHQVGVGQFAAGGLPDPPIAASILTLIEALARAQEERDFGPEGTRELIH